jgi:hypothetical protein
LALAAPEEDEDYLPIARAGSLLVEEGLRPKVGSASILEPGAPAASANGKEANTSASKTPPKATGKKETKPAGQQSGQKSAQGQKNSRPKASAPAKPNLKVILVNETGRPQVGEDYRLVLSRMGYQVVSVSERELSGAAGQTVITYQNGRQSQALALARRLPGQRSVVASSVPLQAEAMVIIR